MGLTVYFGHDGECCPRSSAATKLTVVDITGVHSLRICWCRCQLREDPLQLLSARLYPASMSCPRTAFTFRLLDDFLLSNKISGCPAQSYYDRVRRLTDSAFPNKVPVRVSPIETLCIYHSYEQNRTRELLRVSRQWRNLKLRKWNGFGHERGSISPGELAVSCPACPRPGINLLPGGEQDTDQ